MVSWKARSVRQHCTSESNRQRISSLHHGLQAEATIRLRSISQAAVTSRNRHASVRRFGTRASFHPCSRMDLLEAQIQSGGIPNKNVQRRLPQRTKKPMNHPCQGQPALPPTSPTHAPVNVVSARQGHLFGPQQRARTPTIDFHNHHFCKFLL